MRVAIIGVNGYLGKHLALQLNEIGWEVNGYGRQAQPSIPLKYYINVDINNPTHLKNLNLDVDFVFHFAGVTGTLKAYDDYQQYVNVNEIGLLNVLNEMRKQVSSARLIYPSTRLIYKGAKDNPLKETDEKEFKTIYALTKWFGEQVIQQYCQYFGIPFTIYRLCVPYGNLFNQQYSYGTVGFFLSNAQKGKEINLYGDGNIKRTLTHVSDIVSQIVESLKHKGSLNSILNIGGESYSLKDMAVAIASIYKVKVTYSEWPEMDKLIESGDTIFDDTLIRSLISKPDQFNFIPWLSQMK